MSATLINISMEIALRTEECWSCGVIFAMTERFQRERVRQKDSFYCPAGHPNHYLGRTHAEQLESAQASVRNLEDTRTRNAQYILGLITKNKRLRTKLAKKQAKS